jgi:hypothetical protein
MENVILTAEYAEAFAEECGASRSSATSAQTSPSSAVRSLSAGHVEFLRGTPEGS